VVEGFEFDRGKLEKIDRLRHDLTHYPKFNKPIDDDIHGILKFFYCLWVMLAKLSQRKLVAKGLPILTNHPRPD
jgi:hypothetical protein